MFYSNKPQEKLLIDQMITVSPFLWSVKIFLTYSLLIYKDITNEQKKQKRQKIGEINK